MNAINNYLDNMFRNLPNTPEVRKAKAELLSMMEDKFEELMSDGKTENEAVGIVISEFGNLEEVAESIGLSLEIKTSAGPAKPMLSIDRIKEYLEAVSARSIMIPLAVALCILCVTSGIMSEIVGGPLGDVIGAAGFFIMIAAAVVLFVTSRNKNKEFEEINHGEASLSVEGAEYVKNEKNSYRPTYGMTVAIGITLCIICIIFPIIISVIPFVTDDFGAILFFLSVAAGVFLIVSSNVRINGFDRLLKLNGTDNMGAEFVSAKDRKIPKWPIVLGIAAVVIVVGIAIAIGAVRLVYGLAFNLSGESINTQYDIPLDEGVNTADGIVVDADACSIVIRTDNNIEDIDISYDGDERLQPEVRFENGVLYITQDAVTGYNNLHDAPELTITVGNDFEINDIDLTMDAGNFSISNLEVGDITGEFDAGSIEVRNCSGARLELTADAGRIDIEDSIFDDITLVSAAGDIELDNTEFENIHVDADIGDILVRGLTDIGYYSVDIECDLGEVEFDGRNEGRAYHCDGTGTGSITVECDLGSVDIG